MSRISAVSAVVPRHRHTQDESADMIARACLPEGTSRRTLNLIQRLLSVRSRHWAMPLDWYPTEHSSAEVTAVYNTVALDLAQEAVTDTLAKAGLTAEEVDMLLFTSIPRGSYPTMDIRLADRMGMRADVRRLPVLGMGCPGGVGAVVRTHDYLRAWPSQVAVAVSVELCSLMIQPGDPSSDQLMAAMFFGDGAAAVVSVGDHVPGSGPRILDTLSLRVPETEHMLALEFSGRGADGGVSAAVLNTVRQLAADRIPLFLANNGLSLSDVSTWVVHPIGSAELDAFTEVLGLPDHALEMSRMVLAERGNMSSATALHVLDATLTRRPPLPGSLGVMFGVGMGIAAELALVRF